MYFMAVTYKKFLFFFFFFHFWQFWALKCLSWFDNLSLFQPHVEATYFGYDLNGHLTVSLSGMQIRYSSSNIMIKMSCQRWKHDIQLGIHAGIEIHKLSYLNLAWTTMNNQVKCPPGAIRLSITAICSLIPCNLKCFNDFIIIKIIISAVKVAIIVIIFLRTWLKQCLYPGSFSKRIAILHWGKPG